MVGPDLNTLVNCDIVNNVSPPPDRASSRRARDRWVKPGRAVWKFLDGGENSLEGMKEFSRLAGELGFEYNVIEGFWQRWSDAELPSSSTTRRPRASGSGSGSTARSCGPGGPRGILREVPRRRRVGAKIDFFDHEAKEVVDLYPPLLREAAAHHLMVDFHGANKPTGESRTWPNEMGREGVYGLEHKGMTEWSRHNTTFRSRACSPAPATTPRCTSGPPPRDLVGAPDRDRGGDVLAIARLRRPPEEPAGEPRGRDDQEHPERVGRDDRPARLRDRRGGRIRRRHGDRWFLAVTNGPTARTAPGPREVSWPRAKRGPDHPRPPGDAAAVKIEETSMSGDDLIEMDLRSGGGFIARFTKL